MVFVTVHQGFGIAGFVTASVAAALRFAVLVVDNGDDRQLVKNLSIATAVVAVVLPIFGVLFIW